MLNKRNDFGSPIQGGFKEVNKYAFAFLSLLVVLLTIYSNSFNGEWHFDDYANIVENSYIKIKSFSWPEIKNCMYGFTQENPSRPLSYLSFAINYKIGGMDVLGFHLVNFIIHYLAAFFLFLFIYKTLKLPLLEGKYLQIAYPVALLSTFFWALNPVHVTSITYIVQRMASMAGLFYIMSMYFYLKGRTAHNITHSLSFYILCGIAGFAAVLSKENAVMLPISILLFDLFLIQGATKENVKKLSKILFLPFLLILITGFIYTDGFSDRFREYEIRDFSLAQRLLTEPRVILFYLSLLFYPASSRLTLLYDIEVSRTLFQPWTTIPDILLIISIIIFVLYIAGKRPLISFCIIFYFLNHLIEGSVFPLELIYEHRNYLPSMLLFIPFAMLAIRTIDYFSQAKIIFSAVALGIILILIGEGYVTYDRNRIVGDDFLLWTDNIKKSPLLSRPHSNLGRYYFIAHDREKALDEYEKAVKLNNFASTAALAIQQYNLGLYYFEKMQNEKALELFEKSSKVIPQFIKNNLHMAKIKLRQNKIHEAQQIIADKLRVYPNNSELLELSSFILFKEGKINEAQIFSGKCLDRNPKSLTALMIMAETCRQKNNYAGAISYWKSVQILDPRNAFANLALIELYAGSNDTNKLDQELHLLFHLKGHSTLSKYIQQLRRDEQLLIYIPEIENYSFVIPKHDKPH